MILLGYLHGLWGIKGWLKVFSYTEPRNNIGQYQRWWVGRNVSEAQPMQLENCMQRGQGMAAKLAGVDDRDAAAGLLRHKIWVPSDQLAPLDCGQYYWHQLIDLEVKNLQGESLGRIAGLMETGANDVLVVAGERERLIPYIEGQVIKKIDLKSHCILVDWASDFL